MKGFEYVEALSDMLKGKEAQLKYPLDCAGGATFNVCHPGGNCRGEGRFFCEGHANRHERYMHM